MPGIWKRRLFERGVERVPADGMAGDDGHVLSNDEVERIARSLIAEAPLDDIQQRAEALDVASTEDGWRTAH
jgi:hypothetical protein